MKLSIPENMNEFEKMVDLNFAKICAFNQNVIVKKSSTSTEFLSDCLESFQDFSKFSKQNLLSQDQIFDAELIKVFLNRLR